MPCSCNWLPVNNVNNWHTCFLACWSKQNGGMEASVSGLLLVVCTMSSPWRVSSTHTETETSVAHLMLGSPGICAFIRHSFGCKPERNNGWSRTSHVTPVCMGKLMHTHTHTVPDKAEDYIHRSGRVGRADALGLVSLQLCAASFELCIP
eukprot:1139138-Pelagomonas_calceolata.AAC.2